MVGTFYNYSRVLALVLMTIKAYCNIVLADEIVQIDINSTWQSTINIP